MEADECLIACHQDEDIKQDAVVDRLVIRWRSQNASLHVSFDGIVFVLACN